MGNRTDSFSIAHITDAHVAPFGKANATLKHLSLAIFEDLVEQCRERADLVLFGGDNIDNRGHGEADLEAFMDLASRLDTWRVIPGNHEAPREGVMTKDRFVWAVSGHGPRPGQTDWSEGFGSVRVIGLDTVRVGRPGGWVSKGTLKFLAKEVRQAPEPHVIVLGHHPIVRPWAPHRLAVWDEEYLVANHDAVRRVLTGSAKVRAYLCGHHHACRVQSVGRPPETGFHQLMTAAPVSFPHAARILHVRDDGIAYEPLMPRLEGLRDMGARAVQTGRKAARYPQLGAPRPFLAYLEGKATDREGFLSVRPPSPSGVDRVPKPSRLWARR